VSNLIPLPLVTSTMLIIAVFLTLVSCKAIWGNKSEVKSWSIPAMLALVTTGFVFWLVALGMEFIFLALALGIGFALGLFLPVVALSFFLSCLILRPWEFLPDQQALLELPRAGALLCLVSLALAKLKDANLDFRWTAELTAFALLTVVMALSALLSFNSSESFEFLVDHLVPISVLMLLLLNGIRFDWEQQSVITVIVISICGLLCQAIWSTLTDPTFVHGISRLQTTNLLGNANDLAACIVIALPFSLWSIFSTGSGVMLRSIGFISLPILLGGLWLSQSRGAILALFVAFLVYQLGIRRRVSWQGALVLLAPIVALLLLQRDAGEIAASSNSRWNYVLAGLGMVKTNPMLGVGVGNYPHFYDFYTPQFLEWGERTAHSSWLLILSEAGPLALLLFATMVLLTLARAWKIRDRYPAYLIAFSGYTVTMTFLSHTYLFLPYVLIALIITQSHLYRVKELESLKKDSKPEAKLIKTVPVVHFLSFILALLFCFEVNPAKAEQTAGNSATEVKLLGAGGIHKPLSTAPLSNDIELFGSRGEVLHFLVQLRSKESCSPLGIAQWSDRADLEANFYIIEFIETQKPSFTGAKPGSYPDPLVPYRVGESLCFKDQRWMLGAVKIPRSQKPGVYSTKISFGGQQLALKVEVWKMVIPEEPTIPFYTEMTTWWNVLGHFGKYESQEAHLAKIYHQLLRKHRIETLSPRIVGPKVEHKSGRPVLNITTHPDREQSFASVNLEGRPDWAYYGFPLVTPDKIYDTETVDYFKAIEWAIGEVGREDRAMIYLWDEPQKDVLPQVRDLARIAKKHSPSLKVMVTITHHELLEPYIDIFAPVMDQYDAEGFPPPKVYHRLQDQGKEVWWYVSCMSHGCMALADSGIPDLVIERPSAHIKVLSWLTSRYGIDAFLYYHVNYAYQFFPKRDPWESQWDFSGNGDGTLVYPGRPGMFDLREHTALASLRLKLLLESSQDGEYINWMEQLDPVPDWWTKQFKQLVPDTRNWNRNYKAYRDLQIKAGRYLNALNG